MSTATISDRLKHGEYLGLWTTIAKRPSGGRSRQKYVPTKTGMGLLGTLVNSGFAEAYVQYRSYEQEYEEARDKVLNLVRDAVDDGEFPPPWEQQPKPVAEALESINAPDTDKVFDPFKAMSESGTKPPEPNNDSSDNEE